jgi:2,5-diketo-D-gluconate reductase A
METERTLSLDDGRRIPAIGFGTWPLTGADATRTVGAALEAGYRLVDTAARYENEKEVGAALRASGVPRRELFATTKLRGSEHGYRSTLRALDESLERLGLDEVDLYLIHWPLPRLKLYVESWKAMIELRERGKALSIGVSNFEPEHIDALIDATGVVPAVNQVELHPEFSQPTLRAYHSRKGIVTEAWRPLGKGGSLRDPVVGAIARKHGRTPAQVVLRWEHELGVVVIPKTASVERMRENLSIFDFALDEEDRARMASLDRGARQGGDPSSHEEL